MCEQRTVQADCLVIGGGLAGLMAAREAARAGLAVAVLSDGPGASPWVHGLNIPLHPDDSVATFVSDTLASGQGLSDPALAMALCGDAPEMLAEIEAMGLCLNRDGEGYQLLRPLGAKHPRVASVGNETGAAVLRALAAQLHGRVAAYPGLRAVRLTTARGRVTGALALDPSVGEWVSLAARVTVLACGGFCGMYPFSTNKRDSGGDGVAMAYLAGAALCDLEFIQFEPSAAVWPESLRGTGMITTMLYEGAVLKNRLGERFMLRYGAEGERVGKDALAHRIATEIAEGRGTAHGGVYLDATALGRDTLVDRYPMYVERYRRVGIDLATTPIELAPAPHTSLGGVQVDEHGQTTVAGLFACGEVTGGLHGANRIGGSAGLETLVFGRRAGRAAARCAQGAPDAPGLAEALAQEGMPATAPPPQGRGSPYAPASGEPAALQPYRAALQQALRNGAGVLRSHDALTASLDTLARAREAVDGFAPKDAREVFAQIRLENDLTAAHLLCSAAIARKDTLGCHVRTDYPKPPAKPYRLTLTRTVGGSALLVRHNVRP